MADLFSTCAGSAGAEGAAAVPGTGGRYRATPGGRILDMANGGEPLQAKPGRPSEGDRVTIKAPDGESSRLVADLVAEAFLDNPHGFDHAVHLDGDVRNDRLENLSWGPQRLEGPDGQAERWVDIGEYIATDQGRVLSKRSGKPLVLSKPPGKSKKPNVSLNNGQGRRLRADIIAEAFGIPNPHRLAHALHKNGDVSDARLENLTYLPGETDESRALGEEWAYLEAESGERLLVSSTGRVFNAGTAMMIGGCYDGPYVMLSHETHRRRGDLVALAFGLENPYGTLHALNRNGDAADCRLANLTFKPEEVRGMECRWRWVPGFEGLYLVGENGLFFKPSSFLNPFERGKMPCRRQKLSYKALVGPDGRKVTKRASDWVALAFAEDLGENPLGSEHPWHVDGDPVNCALSNLSWTPGPPEGRSASDERWAAVPGFPKYIVSNLGRLANASRGWLLSTPAPEAGRTTVTLYAGGRNVTVDLARIVEDLFGADGAFSGDGPSGNVRLPREAGAVAGAPFVEGEAVEVTSTEARRNKRARSECIKLKGSVCTVCGIDLGLAYGPGVSPDVHHLDPICEARGDRPVDPAVDLVPVCPNCHRALHSKPGGPGECYAPDELRERLRASGVLPAIASLCESLRSEVDAGPGAGLR